MTPNDIYTEVNNILYNNNNFLNFSYTKENSDYSGISIFDCFLKKKYVNVSRTNHLSDLIILPHEIFHYLTNDYDAGIITNYNSYYLSEVEGSFANILFGEYFKELANSNELFFTKYYVNLFQNEIEELVIRNQLLDSIKNNNKIRLNKLNKFMDYYHMERFSDQSEIKEYLEIPQEINIKYTLSYLTAIDLYYIYLKDRDFAFYLLKNIRYHKTENDIINLLRRNHVTFMDDDYSNYKDYVKTIKKQEENKM